ncbi:MAG: aminotransferase class III-fold pyridoxal phosphate-dependent enzyme, partial [bacterium]|nr:aminotransferase class III-fold pyridoxal phosphate-dependent enzyme [bacterium]
MKKSKSKIAFVFPGLGSHWKRMGAGLLEDDAFLATIRECDKHTGTYADWKIEEELRKPVDVSRMDETLVGYPCSIAVEIALAEWLKHRGIVPDAVVGHSGGEIPAAYTAGILTLKDSFNIIWNHLDIMKKGAGKGIMAHISLPPEKITEILQKETNENNAFISAQNSPKATIVSGERETINQLVDTLTKKNIFCRRLEPLAPFHTPLMARYKEKFHQAVKNVRAGKPSMPVYSSFRGGLSGQTDYSPSSWTEHMAQTVKFADAVNAMIADGYRIFVEISPHPILTRNIKEIADENILVMGTLKRDEDDKLQLFDSLAGLAEAGRTLPTENWSPEDKQLLEAAMISHAANQKEKENSGKLLKTLENSSRLKREKLISQLVNQSVQEAANEKIKPSDDPDRGFFEMGFDSITTVKLKDSLSRRLGLPLPTTLIFDYPDTRSLVNYLTARLGDTLPEVKRKKRGDAGDMGEPIAVIGMACRFPGGANDLESFWDLLEKGKDTVGEIPKERWDGEAFYSEELSPGKSVTKRGNFISGVDIGAFDAAFFNISPKEARAVDPQQRLLLEVSVEALENAGVSLSGIRGSRVGVFIGLCVDDYKKAHLYAEDSNRIDAYSGTGTMHCSAAGRISYFLGIRGPSISVDTACSSALTAVHTAVRALWNGECETALAGGVNALLAPNMFVYLSQLKTLSEDGTCKTFDESADGYGRGEGCGVLVLKRLRDARAAGDNILALIKGSAVNHDGASTGFTAPNGIAQQEVIQSALENGGVSAESVDYIETHGSGTPLGDPIEIGAIAEIYGKGHTSAAPVSVGTVKTNIGHLEGAAGAAGLIKTVLSLQHEAIPAHIHISNPNRLIDWEHIPVKINTGLTPWKRGETPRRAGVSGFGFSGSNAHIILEEAPEREAEERGIDYPVHILNLSGRSVGALKELAASYKNYLSKPVPPGIEDICYTAAVGRSHFNYRLSIVGKSVEAINRKLETFMSEPGKSIHSNLGNPKAVSDKGVVFLFTGQGSQYAGMAKELYEVEPEFKSQLDVCDGLFKNHIGVSIVELLYSPGASDEVVSEAIHAQPVIFSVEYALSKLWRSWGVEPSLVIGHSIGEYAAACTAGVLRLEDAVKLVAARGKLMQSVSEPGRMIGVLAPEEKVRQLIVPYKDVSIAAVNAPGNVTVSGGRASIEKVMESIKGEKIFIEQLNISHAFHSVMMEPYVERFSRELVGVEFSSPEVPIISTITGREVTDEMGEPGYWGNHICRTVRFSEAVKQACGEGFQLFIEVGGTAALAGLAGQCVVGGDYYFIPSLRKGRHGCEHILAGLAQLYLRGADINWKGFYGPFDRGKVVLPGYPFQRERYWWDIVSEVSEVVPVEGEVVPVRGRIDEELGKMIQTVSGLEPGDLGGDSDLFSLGLDSLMLVELRRKIVGQYGIDITLNEFFMELTTINKIVEYINCNLPEAEARIPVFETKTKVFGGPGTFFQKGSWPPEAKVAKPLNFSSTANVAKRGFTERQQRHLDGLIERYVERTRSSKGQVEAYRHVLADSKATVGFSRSVKEMLYPLVGKRAWGSRLWDIDGNEYIDITMGFGVYLFGHHPAFLGEALREAREDETELGPRSYLVGEVAEGIARLTGMERVTFTNTGTEAVMAAIRLARAATGRSKIALFSRSYHGHSDGTLAVSTVRDGRMFSEPVSPGIPHSVTGEVLVVDYLEPRSLDILREQGHELAAVLVEPVQSRYPGVEPGGFLRELREVVSQSGAVLIFDEMITGFRFHPGGAQAYYNVRADICTYGKVVGGGLPIGVIAGKAEYLDHIDGGVWEYGDDSYPRVERTFFGGTFCQYHEAMAAARAVLSYLEEQGESLQQRLNEKTRRFAETLNDYFETNNITMQVSYSGSLFRFEIPGGMDIFYYHMLEKGVYIWEWRCCFLSTAHTEEDLAKVIDAVKETVAELEAGGFSLSRQKEREPLYYPMSSVQKRLYALSQTEAGDLAYHTPMAVEVTGALDVKKTGTVFRRLIGRHEILRTSLIIKEDQPVQQVHDAEEVSFVPVYKKCGEVGVGELIDDSLRRFDLSRAPLMRVVIAEISSQRFFIILNFHHSVMDGVSLTLLLRDFTALYNGEELPPVRLQYKELAQWEQHYRELGVSREHEAYWLNRLGGLDEEPAVLELPTDYPRPDTMDFEGKTLRFTIGETKTSALKRLSREAGASLNMTLTALLNVFLFKLTDQEDICIGIPATVKEQGGFEHTVGMFTNTLVMRNQPVGDKCFISFLKEVKISSLQAYANEEYPYEELTARLGGDWERDRNPLFDVAFMYENGNDRLFELPGLTFRPRDIDLKASPFDLVYGVIEEGGVLNVGIIYRTALFKEETIERWHRYVEMLMDGVLVNRDVRLRDLEIMTRAEKRRIIEEFNGTATDYPRDKTIHQLFEEQAAKTPDRIAVSAGFAAHRSYRTHMTYNQLNLVSGHLAGRLQKEGIRPGSIVGIMVERSIEMIVGIMGILKAGGAYLPIEPDFPEERKKYMLADSGAELLLTIADGALDLIPTHPPPDGVPLSRGDLKDWEH